MIEGGGSGGECGVDAVLDVLVDIGKVGPWEPLDGEGLLVVDMSVASDGPASEHQFQVVAAVPGGVLDDR